MQRAGQKPTVVFSRRTLLVGTPVVAALAVAAGCARHVGTVLDVTTFGARGDGATDDSLAIQAAVGALRSRDTLHFPPGTYRFAQLHPPGTAAIVLTGVSDVAIEFDPGAELWMDNLDPVTHTGTSHGVLINGPAARISLRHVSVRWTAGAKRSLGDGIRVMGCPVFGEAPPAGWSGPRTPVNDVVVSDCAVRASPQAGVIMLGVSDITVTGLRVDASGADGLHFNACRRARIDDVRAVNTGDDGLALVTYFAERFTFDDAARTFSFPALTNWSNADFVVTNVSVVGGRANGVRIAGAHRVTVGGLSVAAVRSGSAVMVDSAEPGTDVGWDYVASRAVRIDDVAATNCDNGIHLLARPGLSGDGRFTAFDVRVDEAKLDGCGNWSVLAESLTDRRATGLHMTNCAVSSTSTTGGNGGVGIANADAIALQDVSIQHVEPVVVFSAVNAGRLEVDRLSVTITRPDQPVDPAPPCVSVDDSDGVVADMDLGWSAAPDSWSAVRLSAIGRCGDVLRDEPITTTRLEFTAVEGDPACS